MKIKTFWRLFLPVLIISMMVSSSVFANFVKDMYGCATTFNSKFKQQVESSKGDYLIATVPLNLNGYAVLGTTIGADTLNNLPWYPCFLYIFSEDESFTACIDFASFVPTDYSKDGKNHAEKASFTGIGGFIYTGDNSGGQVGNFEINCDKVSIKEDVNDDVLQIFTGSCKFSGGLSLVQNVNEIIPGYTFTGTMTPCTLIPLTVE